jgi:hypothetical protein
VEFGVHLPLLSWNEEPFDPASLTEYVRTADRLGFSAVSVSDHLQHRRPWLDGLTALASVLGASGDMTVATTIALAVVRTPVPLAKALAAIDLLSGGRLVVGLGPGSYKPDTTRRACRGRNGGPGSTKPSARYARCGVPTATRSRASSAWSPDPRRREDRRSGSGAGDRTPGFDGSLAWETDGLPRATTPRPKSSPEGTARLRELLHAHGKIGKPSGTRS